MNKVLIVEDLPAMQSLYRRQLEKHGVKVYSAFSVDEAEVHFSQHNDWSVIVFDACVPGHEPNTLELVRKFRQRFSGPMVASSGELDNRRLLLQAGCDYESPDKKTVPYIVLEILGL